MSSGFKWHKKFVDRIYFNKYYWPLGSQTIPPKAWKLHGTGVGTIGDDGVPCRNGWQVYGLYMTATDTPSKSGGKPSPSADALAVKSTGKPSTARTRGSVTTKNGNKRQAVYESDLDDAPIGINTGATPSKPFQWFTKTFAFVKRMFTFVIIPFFKFVRNTFFQTRSLDDTVVDVSETHLTVSDVKYTPKTTTTKTTTAAADFSSVEDFLLDDHRNSDDNDGRRPLSSSKRETSGRGVDDEDERCTGLERTANEDRVMATDLVEAGVTSVADDVMSPNTRRYLRMVTDGLNDVGINVAFVKRTFACCRHLHINLSRPLERQRSDAATLAVMVVDWDRTRVKVHNVTASPYTCGRLWPATGARGVISTIILWL